MRRLWYFLRHDLWRPVFGVVRNPTDLGVYCGWVVIWFDWSETPITGKRVSIGFDVW